jgi:serine/threonine protein kinase/Tfp pilus assembly protein PilF
MADDTDDPVAGDTRDTRPPDESDEPGGQIGPYHLLQKVGEGGMGEVWKAEQREPIRRTVAVKVIKIGMDTRQVVARFDGERQALAVMDHPAIAKVLDAGATAGGRPYFVMEYVKGEPITAYCDRHRLSTADRLALFARVCEGVQHAHQKGIIHRDVKPSNVLVTLQDGRPVPKIIDFGIAKATAHHLTARTVFTELGALIGTPEYMSPEQAEMGGLDIDTRADIYSLGVLLYELLTGTVPFEPRTLREKALDEIRRTIRETDPPRPSTRVTQLGPASEEAAKNRLTEPARLATQLRGDLDWITMKALEKDRTRRYDTAMGLAEDVGRYLRHEPVSAGPPRAAYRAGKFVRRHRFGVAAAGTIVALLLAFAVVMAVQARAIARERDRANREAAAARQVSDFLVSLFKVSDPSESKGDSVTAREILDQGAVRIERDLAQQPLTQASLMTTMGQAYMNLGLYGRADPVLAKGLATRRRLLGERTEEARVSLLALGDLRWREGKYDEGERLLTQALAVAEGIDREGPGVAEALLDLSALYDTQARSAEAESCLRRALAIGEKRLDPDDQLMGRILNNLGSTLWNQGQYAEAGPLFLRSLAQKEKTLGPVHPQVANTLNNLGVLYQTQGKFKEGEPYLLRALAICEKVYGPEHRVVGDLANNLGSFYYEQKRYAEAQPYYQRALAIYEKALGPGHDDVGMVLHNIANIARNQGRYAEAEPLYVRSHAIFEKALGAGHPYVGRSFRERATLYREMGRWADAESLYQKALAVLEKNPGPEHPQVAETLEEYAALLRKMGRGNEADGLAARAKSIRDRNPS